MKILLTGTTGLLGRSFIEYCRDAHELFCIVRNKSQLLLDEYPNVNFIEQDLKLPLNPDNLPTTIDAVVHLAQSSKSKMFPDAAEDIYAINTHATFQLLEYARCVGAKHFIYTSTGSVYETDYTQTKEDQSVSPSSFYASTKLASEALVNAYAGFFDVCVLRLFFLYGQYQNEDRLIAKIYNHINNNVEIEIAGSEGIEFTPTYSSDVAFVINKALQEKWRGCFNIASPKTTTIKQLTLQISELLNKKPLFSYNNSDPTIIIPDLTKLKKIYPDMRFTSLGDGLRQTFMKRCVRK